MVKRELAHIILQQSKKMPVIAITGPRQSGKTTLAKSIFPNYTYLNLEFPDIRARALDDPRLFLQTNSDGIVLDEIQHTPELFSYIHGIVDDNKKPGQYILTGSHNFMLLEKISQSLAGRVSLFNLLPFSLSEINSVYPLPDNYLPTLFKGSYPRLYDQGLHPNEWYPSYIQSYIERDARQIVNIQNLNKFQMFVKLCAGRIGQLFNASSIATEIGVDYKTIQAWISVLQTSFIIFLLPPYHKNFNKRLVKSPKLYFYDSGLACSLLGIRSPDDLLVHFLRGELYESFIMSELHKQNVHSNRQINFYYWRDSAGHEIDCIYEQQSQLNAIEIKSGMTINSDFFRGLEFWKKLTGASVEQCSLVYGGNEDQQWSQGRVLGWKNCAKVLNV